MPPSPEVARRNLFLTIGLVVAFGGVIAFALIRGHQKEQEANDRAKLKDGARAWFEKEGLAKFLEEHGKPDLPVTKPLRTPVMVIAARDDERFIYFGSDLEKYTNLPITDSVAHVATVAISIEDTVMYTMGALTTNATIVFVDMGTKEVVGRKNFKSSEHPGGSITIDGMTRWDDTFWAPIADWVNSLPRD